MVICCNPNPMMDMGYRCYIAHKGVFTKGLAQRVCSKGSHISSYTTSHTGSHLQGFAYTDSHIQEVCTWTCIYKVFVHGFTYTIGFAHGLSQIGGSHRLVHTGGSHYMGVAHNGVHSTCGCHNLRVCLI